MSRAPNGAGSLTFDATRNRWRGAVAWTDAEGMHRKSFAGPDRDVVAERMEQFRDYARLSAATAPIDQRWEDSRNGAALRRLAAAYEHVGGCRVLLAYGLFVVQSPEVVGGWTTVAEAAAFSEAADVAINHITRTETER